MHLLRSVELAPPYLYFSFFLFSFFSLSLSLSLSRALPAASFCYLCIFSDSVHFFCQTRKPANLRRALTSNDLHLYTRKKKLLQFSVL